MKKALLLILYFTEVVSGFSQTCISLLDTHRTWSELSITTCGLLTTSYKCQEDTLINGLVYTKVFSCINDSTLSTWCQENYFLREDESCKVFKFENFTEKLMYDFDLQTGDSVFTGGQLGGQDLYALVDIVDSIPINGSYRKRIIFDPWFQETWIAGIGSLSSPFSPFFNTITSDWVCELLCVHDSLLLSYSNPIYNDCFITLVGENRIELIPEMIKIYPQPMKEGAFIEVRADVKEKISLCLMNENGKVVFKDSFTGKYFLERNNCSPGLYVLSIEFQNHRYRVKLILS